MRDWRGMLLSPCAVLLTMAGCSKAPAPEAPATPEPTLSQEPATPSDLPAMTALPTESGLAIKRGIATIAAERSTFVPCGEQRPLLMIDQTDGVLARTFESERDPNSADRPLRLYIEAYGERTTDVPAGAAGFAGTFLMEEALYAAPDGQTRGCEASPGDYIVAAHGNEPFWNVQVTDAALLWRQPQEPAEISIAAPQTQNSEGAVSYTAANDAHQIEVLILAQSCVDDMSGEYFAYAARATLDGKRYMGCARIGK
jgi:uncharacterized membrane protein